MATTQWGIDPAHSEIQFKVRHMMISTVTGSFGTFEGNLSESEVGLDGATVSFKADVQSITTGNNQRDEHLKSPDFFDVAAHPELFFQGTLKANESSDSYSLNGTLNLHGHSKEVSLAVEFSGEGKDPWGNVKSGFSLSGNINRKDWGLNWNAPIETGGLLVSEEVKLQAEIQLIKK